MIKKLKTEEVNWDSLNSTRSRGYPVADIIPYEPLETQEDFDCAPEAVKPCYIQTDLQEPDGSNKFIDCTLDTEDQKVQKELNSFINCTNEIFNNTEIAPLSEQEMALLTESLGMDMMGTVEVPPSERWTEISLSEQETDNLLWAMSKVPHVRGGDQFLLVDTFEDLLGQKAKHGDLAVAKDGNAFMFDGSSEIWLTVAPATEEDLNSLKLGNSCFPGDQGVSCQAGAVSAAVGYMELPIEQAVDVVPLDPLPELDVEGYMSYYKSVVTAALGVPEEFLGTTYPNTPCPVSPAPDKNKKD